MASTPEAKVKAKVKKLLDELGVYYFFAFTGGFGRAGIPDIICCIDGKFVAIECKAGKNTTTALQDREIDAIRANKGLAFVINEQNISDLQEALAFIRRK